MSDFPEFPKIPRLSRECVITEKLDGTNGLIEVVALIGGPLENAGEWFFTEGTGFALRAGSRTRWLDCTSSGDNYGFAKWVRDNAEDLVRLGVGLHYGEWWGKGIQRNYSLVDRRFSLFNTSRWSDPTSRPACCSVVPILYQGIFDTPAIHAALGRLEILGSVAAPGFMYPEGIMVYHVAANQYFKKTIKGDESPKGKV